MLESQDRDPSLAAAFQALAEDEAGIGASAGVEARLLSEVRAIGVARRRRQHRAVLAVAAAAMLVIAGLATWRSRMPAAPTREAATSPASITNEVATAFLPLVYGNVPVTDAQLVRLEVPRSALRSFGLLGIEPADESSSATVVADVVVGEDGLARAVRFVRPAAKKE